MRFLSVNLVLKTDISVKRKELLNTFWIRLPCDKSIQYWSEMSRITRTYGEDTSAKDVRDIYSEN